MESGGGPLTTETQDAENEQSVPLDQFTLFPQLPVELQLEIWSEVSTPYDEPRIHAICGYPRLAIKEIPRIKNLKSLISRGRLPGACKPQTELPPEEVVFLSAYPTHPILHTCRTSREAAISSFNLTFAFGTFINLDRDVILADKSFCIDDFSSQKQHDFHSLREILRHDDLRAKIKRLAVFNEQENVDRGARGALIMNGFSELKELFVIRRDGRPSSYNYLSKDLWFADAFETTRGQRLGHVLRALWQSKELAWTEKDWDVRSKRPVLKSVALFEPGEQFLTDFEEDDREYMRIPSLAL